MGSNYLMGMSVSLWNDSRVMEVEKEAPKTLNSLNAIELCTLKQLCCINS